MDPWKMPHASRRYTTPRYGLCSAHDSERLWSAISIDLITDPGDPHAPVTFPLAKTSRSPAMCSSACS